jgi:hypothetical protein
VAQVDERAVARTALAKRDARRVRTSQYGARGGGSRLTGRVAGTAAGTAMGARGVRAGSSPLAWCGAPRVGEAAAEAEEEAEEAAEAVATALSEVLAAKRARLV